MRSTELRKGITYLKRSLEINQKNGNEDLYTA